MSKHSPIKKGIFVKVNGVPGHARVEDWISKDGLILLDRKLGGYYTYRHDQLTLLTTREALEALRKDNKESQP